jgi:hypothetical protein
MSFDDRYAIKPVTDRLWVVIDEARQGSKVGLSGDEIGARRIVSFLNLVRTASARDQGGKRSSSA